MGRGFEPLRNHHVYKSKSGMAYAELSPGGITKPLFIIHVSLNLFFYRKRTQDSYPINPQWNMVAFNAFNIKSTGLVLWENSPVVLVVTTPFLNDRLSTGSHRYKQPFHFYALITL